MNSVIRSAEFWVTLALCLVSVVVLVDALKLPGGEFDPLGPGAAPEMVASVLIVLCLLVLVRTVLRGRREVPGAGDRIAKTEDGTNIESTPRALVLFFCFLFAYLLAFQYEAGHFVAITVLFLFAATIALRGWDLRSVLLAASVAVCLSASMFFALTRFFVIRLPGAF